MSKLNSPPLPRLILAADTAEELMVSNPISIEASLTVPEAVELMTLRGLSAAPVIDEAGRPVGVLTQSDLLIHRREEGQHARSADQAGGTGRPVPLVRDIMTPVIFTVTPHTLVRAVVEQMLSLKVHHLFVVEDGVLVGVISSLDILRHLQTG
jgi:CBS domain-containing protein